MKMKCTNQKHTTKRTHAHMCHHQNSTNDILNCVHENKQPKQWKRQVNGKRNGDKKALNLFLVLLAETELVIWLARLLAGTTGLRQQFRIRTAANPDLLRTRSANPDPMSTLPLGTARVARGARMFIDLAAPPNHPFSCTNKRSRGSKTEPPTMECRQQRRFFVESHKPNRQPVRVDLGRFEVGITTHPHRGPCNPPTTGGALASQKKEEVHTRIPLRSVKSEEVVNCLGQPRPRHAGESQ